MTIIKFIMQFFQDQDGNSSSKRIASYVLLAYMYMLVNASIQGKTINDNVLMIVAGTLCLCLGVITAEFITKFKNKDKE